MDKKTKQILRTAILEKMQELKMGWNFACPKWAAFPVAPRTCYSICDKDSYNFALATLIKLCEFLGLKYTIDGSVLKIQECEQN